MNNLDKEYLSQLIVGFTDGELSAEEENLLSEAIKQDASLMDDIKHHLAIKEAVKKDIKSFTPPSVATKNIFSQLGYNSPYSQPPTKRKWSPFYKKISAVAILLLTTLSFYQLFNNSSSESNSNNSSENINISKSNSTNNNSTNNIINNSIPTTNSVSNDSKEVNHNIKSNDSKIRSNSNISNYQKTDELTSLNSSNEQVYNENLYTENVSNYPVINNITNSSISQDPNLEFIKINTHRNNQYINNNYSMNYFELPQNEYKLFTKSYMNFSDFSIGAILLSKNNFKGGLEIGKQNYSVNISENDENDIINTQKNILWITALARYDFEEIKFNGIVPFLQFAIGSSDFGNGKYMIRYSSGIEYSLFESGIGLLLSYEGSNLWYSTQSNPYITSKSGVVMGISYKF